MRTRRLSCIGIVLWLVSGSLPGIAARVCVFEQLGFPTADTSPIRSPELHRLFPKAAFIDAGQLPDVLRGSDIALLVMPYGSAFPENQWMALKGYLDRGGNLLVLGGRPFTRAAFRDSGLWRLREYSVRFSSELRIDQYQETPSSSKLAFLSNTERLMALPAFAWQQGFSPILHLSSSRISERGGAAGRIDARLDALAWGTRDGHRVSAPIIEIDQ